MTIKLARVRSGTTTDWASGPTLLAGEIGVDTTLGVVKVGDGSTSFASLKALGGGRTIVGNATLAAGTVTVGSLTGVTSAAEVVVSVKTLGTVTAPKVIRATPGTNQVVFTSEDVTDTSVISYVVVID